MSAYERASVAVPLYLLGPGLRDAIDSLYGQSREARVLDTFLTSRGPVTLSCIARLCSAGERSIRNDGRGGWLRALLVRYRDCGVLVEKASGNRITYELNEASPAVALLREMRRTVLP